MIEELGEGDESEQNEQSKYFKFGSLGLFFKSESILYF